MSSSDFDEANVPNAFPFRLPWQRFELFFFCGFFDLISFPHFCIWKPALFFALLRKSKLKDPHVN